MRDDHSLPELANSLYCRLPAVALLKGNPIMPKKAQAELEFHCKEEGITAILKVSFEQEKPINASGDTLPHLGVLMSPLGKMSVSWGYPHQR